MSALLWNHAQRPGAVLVLAHGAGAPMDSDVMTTLAVLLAARGFSVCRFEFPYMARRRREGVKAPPDRPATLLACFAQVLEQVRARQPDLPLWVGGKSMGGRMATMMAAGAVPGCAPLKGAVVFGYPFHPPGKPERTRLDHFPALRVPVLICQGERDPFGKPAEVAGYALPEAVTVRWIVDGDHDMKPRKASGRSRQQNLACAAEQAAVFLTRH